MRDRHRKKEATAIRRAILRRRRRRRRRFFLLLELMILLILVGSTYLYSKFDLMNYQSLEHKNLEVYKDTGNYTNIALFGLDSREGELDGGVRSDCMMIASINHKTDEVKIISVYRDTLLRQSDGSYSKANSAYSYGGPAEAIALLNRNLDLDIQKYISVDFNAMVDIVDALGGVEIDVQEEEIIYINGYSTEITKVTGVDTPPVVSTGPQTLNGVQATAYARIRYTSGDDFKRTERQRLVLQKIVEKAQQSDLATLNQIINDVLPQISTNLTAKNFLGLAANGLKYKIGEMSGFPFDVTTSENVRGLSGSYVIPIGLSDNVSQLHAFLFDKSEYPPSDQVQEINDDIEYLSGVSSIN